MILSSQWMIIFNSLSTSVKTKKIEREKGFYQKIVGGEISQRGFIFKKHLNRADPGKNIRSKKL